MRYLVVGLRRAARATSALAVSLVVASCATGTGSKPQATWRMAESTQAESIAAESGRAKIVVFRLARSGEAGGAAPLNVFFNNSYHASLLPDARATVLSMCPGVGGVRIEEGGKPGLKVGFDANEAIEMKSGAVYYYQVASDDAGKPAVRLVEESQAAAIVGALPQQSHTISRVVADSCAVPVEVPTEVFNLNSEALFAFDRSDLAGMLPSGRDELKRVADTVSKNYSRVDRIEVMGHTDPTGSSSYNQKLSEGRAKSVAKALLGAGLASDRITTKGLGESQLIVSDCAGKGKGRKAIQACNQPNRRVEIAVYGVRQEGNASPTGQ